MAKILNNILCTAMAFLLTFAWTVYCLKNVKLALILSVTVAACTCYIIFALLSKLETKQKNRQKVKNTLKNFATLLQFNADNCKLFLPMLNFYGYTVTETNFDNAVLEKDGRTFAAFCFQSEALTLQQIQKAVVDAKRHNCSKLIVFCNKTDGTSKQIANSQIPTEFVDLSNTFALFSQAEKLPQIPQTNTPKQHILPQYVFNKKRFLWYFLGAFFTLATSFVSLFKVYLLVWSTLLFSMALFCLLNKKYNKISTDVSL